MPPKKNLTKKNLFKSKKTLLNRGVNSILFQCKVNNNPLKCGKKCPYKPYEKRSITAKFS